ncbi:MAG: DciA family protein [Cypionkella sp.]|nr:DciA family protein [Cypionkella sp.]
MARKPAPAPSSERRMRGFEAAFGFVKEPVRHAGESRGFAVAKLLTHWEEVVGAEFARKTRPVKIGYGREGLGATLTLLTSGAEAPMIEMQKDRIREKVNTVYGYNAIARIHLTQTAATGFAEGQAEFTPAPRNPPAPDPEVVLAARETAAPIRDEGLRQALETLALNVLNRRKAKESE